jgi:hypothetical protein
MVVDSVLNFPHNFLQKPNRVTDAADLQKKGFITSRKNSMTVQTNSKIKALEKVRESPGTSAVNIKQKQIPTKRIDLDSNRTLYQKTNVKDYTLKTYGVSRINETIETRSYNKVSQTS